MTEKEAGARLVICRREDGVNDLFCNSEENKQATKFL